MRAHAAKEMLDEAVNAAKQSDVWSPWSGEAQGWRMKPPAGPTSRFRKASGSDCRPESPANRWSGADERAPAGAGERRSAG